MTISTDLGERPGIRAAAERWLTARMIRPMLAEELVLLERGAAG